MEDNYRIIEGRNAVLEALQSDKTIEKILIQKGQREGSIHKIFGMAKSQKVVIQQTDKAKLDALSTTKKHQGVIAYTSPFQYVEIEDILGHAKNKNEDPFILILENIVDPHNLGAIIRTANGAGAHGIIIPKRRATGITAVVAKASAGGVEYAKIAKVPNIGRTIEHLKELGIWIVCSDFSGEIYHQLDLKGPICLVVGSEGEGVSRLVKEKSDFTATIPMKGQISSLNASVAAGLLLYEVNRQRYC